MRYQQSFLLTKDRAVHERRFLRNTIVQLAHTDSHQAAVRAEPKMPMIILNDLLDPVVDQPLFHTDRLKLPFLPASQPPASGADPESSLAIEKEDSNLLA